MNPSLQFVKMHGLGNDYVYVDTREQAEPAMGWPELAKRVSDRRFGIGSDGLILIEKGSSSEVHGRMRMFNSDGSESEMCGNGLRCVAKYLHDELYPGADQLDIETGAGLLRVLIIERDSQQLAELVEVDMGLPILEAEKIPLIGQGQGKEETLIINQQEISFTAVSMGNPHCVIFEKNVDQLDLESIGRAIETLESVFPNRVNVEFVEVVSETEVIQRTWERGSGETLACGTGASAVAVAAQLRGHCGPEVLVHLKGGDLKIRWEGPGSTVKMTGTATHVYKGQIQV